MSALPRWQSFKQCVIDDARLANWNAHIESPEVPKWVAETDDDMASTLGDALSDLVDKRRDKVNDLLGKLCEQGDGLSMREADDLHNYLRQALTDFVIRKAQTMVDDYRGYGSNAP